MNLVLNFIQNVFDKSHLRLRYGFTIIIMFLSFSCSDDNAEKRQQEKNNFMTTDSIGAKDSTRDPTLSIAVMDTLFLPRNKFLQLARRPDNTLEKIILHLYLSQNKFKLLGWEADNDLEYIKNPIIIDIMGGESLNIANDTLIMSNQKMGRPFVREIRRAVRGHSGIYLAPKAVGDTLVYHIGIYDSADELEKLTPTKIFKSLGRTNPSPPATSRARDNF